MRVRAAWGLSCLLLVLCPVSAGAQTSAHLPHHYAGAGMSPAGSVGHTGMLHSGYYSGPGYYAAPGYYSGGAKYSKSGGGYWPYYATNSYNSGYGYYTLPPLFVPAGMMFGPDPLMQGIGNLNGGFPDGGAARGPAARGPAPRGQAPPAGNLAAGQGAVAGPINNAQLRVRVTNAATKARAGKFLQAGDTQFGKQKFHAALERYREAALAAPDLADGFYRQGFAQAALGQYDAAVKLFQRGLRLNPDWAESGFELATLYGDNHLAKLSHREALAQTIEQNPLDAGPLMVMGMLLYFDGQQDRSRLFFQKAADLGGNQGQMLAAFLVQAPAPADPDEKPVQPDAAVRPLGKIKL